jgi:CBS-domain-containing membrane protein
MISFGPTVFIALALHKSDIAQPKNIFLGHLVCIITGIIFNEFIGVSFITLGLSVGVSVALMMYFKCVHPPAVANPLIALLSDVSFEYILFPVISGSLLIIVLSIIINKYILKRNYPFKKLI